MMNRWRSVRVFVSSTFRDMHAERDHLVKVVFPALRERLEPHRVHLIDIDLRWGLTREQAENDQVLDLCLRQIDECRPFFIGILGQRYGWVPEKLTQDVVKGKYGWVAHHTGKSVTELEILHGVLNSEEMRWRAFFYFRDPSAVDAIPENVRRAIYVETEPVWIQKLAALKDQIRSADLPVMDPYPARWEPNAYDRVGRGYGRLTGLEKFGERVSAQLWEAIRQELSLTDMSREAPQDAVVDSLAEERDYHDRFVEARLRVYVGRDSVQRQLIDYAQSDDTRLLLVTGLSGAGKSAVLAKMCETLAAKFRVVSHFVGASPASTNIRRVLRRFCLELYDAFLRDEMERRLADVERTSAQGQEIEREYDIPEETAKLSTTFRDFLARVPQDRRVLFVIDALDQLDEADRAHELSWLPRTLPPHVKIVVSTIAGPGEQPGILHSLRRGPVQEIEVGPITPHERVEIVKRVPSLSAKSLDAQQIELLLSNPATSNPLYLLVALEELRGFGSFELLNRRIGEFPREGDTVAAIFDQVVERLEEEFDAELVRTILALLAVSRHGLSERDLEELTAGLAAADDLYPVLRQLRAYLEHRGPLVDFYHRSLFKAVRERYLADEPVRRAWHHRLAEHFATKGFAHQPTLADLPWQLTQAGDWDDLEHLLCDLTFIEAKCVAGMTYDLQADYAVALDAWPGYAKYDPFGPVPAPAPSWMQECIEAIIAGQPDPHPHDGAGPVLAALQRLPDSEREPEPQSPAYGDGERIADVHFGPDCGTAAVIAEMDRVRKAWDDGIDPHYADTSAGRVACFAGFVTTHLNLINALPRQTIFLAHNQAKAGLVAEHAEALVEVFDRPWVVRDVRPLPPPTRPTALRTLGLHPDGVSRVAITPDGRTAVAGTNSYDYVDDALWAWDVTSGEHLPALKGPFGGSTLGVTADGTTALSAADGTISVWDLGSGACRRNLHAGRRRDDGAFTPDGRMAITGPPLRVWDIASGSAVRSFDGDVSSTSVALTPDGKVAITNGNEAHLYVWDVAAGKCLSRLRAQMPGPPQKAPVTTRVALSHDARIAVSVSRDNVLLVWDIVSGICLRALKGHQAHVTSVTLAPDGQMVMAGSHDTTARIWDVASGACLQVLQHDAWVKDVALTADCKTALTATGKTLKLWNISSGAPAPASGPQPEGQFVTRVVSSLDGRRALVCGGEGISVWNVDSGECLALLEAPRLSVEDVVITSDGSVAVSADRGPLRAWDVETGECLWARLAGTGVHAVSLSPDGRTVLSAHDDNALRLWDVHSGACLRVLPGHTDKVRRIVFAPDGRTALSASADGTLRNWDIVSGQCLNVHKRNGVWVRDAAFTPDGRIAISGNRRDGKDNALCVWDVGSGALLRTLGGHTNEVRAIAVTPDGRRAVSASFDHTVRIWSLASGACLATLEGHLGPVTGVALSCDGSVIASSSDDYTLRVWDVASGASLAVYPAADFVKPGGERIWEVGAPELRAMHVAGNMNVLAASAVTPNGRLVCATNNGEMHFLTLRNLQSIPLVTAVRLFGLILGELGPPVMNDKANPVFDETRPLPGSYEEDVTAGCPWCGNRFAVPDLVLDAIHDLGETRSPSPSNVPRSVPSNVPCLDLPADAWNEPRLSSQCSHCGGGVRFNPFLVDRRSAG